MSACSQHFDHAQNKQDQRKRLVLHILRIMGERVNNALISEWPDFSVAEHQQEDARNQKAQRPGVARVRPTLDQCRLRQEKKRCENHKHAGEMMIEFAFPLVPHVFCLKLWTLFGSSTM